MRIGIFMGLSIALMLFTACGDISKEVSQNKLSSETPTTPSEPDDTNPQVPDPGQIVTLSSLGSCNRSATAGHCEDYAMISQDKLDAILALLGSKYTAKELLDEYLADLETECLEFGGVYNQNACPTGQRSHICKYAKNIQDSKVDGVITDRVYYHEASIQAYDVSDRVTSQQLVFRNGRWQYRYSSVRSAQAQDDRLLNLIDDFCTELEGDLTFNISP